ncbi:hypothetical protein Dimus_003752 [Dionaea muscipula]
MVMLKNISKAKFELILLPIADACISKEQREYIDFEAFFTHIIFHECCHGIGPYSIVLPNGQDSTVRLVFICEQKLYNRTQLDQDLRTGDSEVDGTETERGGFTGHPLCDLCRFPFYGDNELYTHMSTEHYTCHIFQRQHPGQYEYYRNYDDLETHFRKDHFLYEDETCLAKKFIVFQSDTELKKMTSINKQQFELMNKKQQATTAVVDRCTLC